MGSNKIANIVFTILYFFNLQQHLQTRLIHREPRSDREEFQTLLHLDTGQNESLGKRKRQI